MTTIRTRLADLASAAGRLRGPTLLAATLALGLVGCRQIGLAPEEPDPRAVEEDPTLREARRVTVQHVLVSFDEGGAGAATRTRGEAAKLAQKVYDLARRGHAFADLVYLYSDDAGSADTQGRYELANFGVDAGPDQMERSSAVQGFGDAAFEMSVGEIRMVAYDATRSPYGWHVIKRLR